MRHPPEAWQTFTPVPRSTQSREQQFDPLSHGLPPWPQPPAPPPVMSSQRPGVPSVWEHTPEQQSEPV